MVTKVIQFVKAYQADIILLIGVVLISLLSFAAGYIVSEAQKKTPIQFEQSYEKQNN